jgi:beta-1,4-mannosyltransferase
MKILIACNLSANPYVGQLVDALLKNDLVDTIQTGTNLFWIGNDFGYDILHFQWPEALFYQHEPDHDQLIYFEKLLNSWKLKSRIVSTVHNEHKHYEDTDGYSRLYSMVYQNSDVVIHLGRASIDVFNTRYRDCINTKHVVIPHGDFSYFPNCVSKTAARKWLSIDEDKFVCLSFGKIRHREELEYIVRGFYKFHNKNKFLIVAGKLSWPSTRYQRWYNKVQKIFGLPMKIYNNFISDYHLQYFYNAADVAIIPRLKILNSGNVPLGFAFGKVVIGPDTGVVGEILKETGNPVFIPGEIMCFVIASGLCAYWSEHYIRSKMNSKNAADRYGIRHIRIMIIWLYEIYLSVKRTIPCIKHSSINPTSTIYLLKSMPIWFSAVIICSRELQKDLPTTGNWICY